jgi:hypothetical protein
MRPSEVVPSAGRHARRFALCQSDTTAATLAAMHEAARAGPEALWLAKEAIHESKFSPFLDSGNKSARQAEKMVATLF